MSSTLPISRPSSTQSGRRHLAEPSDPRLQERSGQTLLRCAPSQKVLAFAFKRNEGRVSRWCSGGDRHSPVLRAYEAVSSLARHPKCTAFPLIIDLEVFATSQQVASASTHDLIKRWWELFEHEPAAEAIENEASQLHHRRRDLRALAAAHRAEAALQVEFAAVCEELDRRKVDPSEDGMP